MREAQTAPGFTVPGGWEGPVRVSLPFPFSSKKGEGRLVGGGAGTNKERRPKTPAVVALVSEGLLRNPIRLDSECDAGTFQEGEIM